MFRTFVAVQNCVKKKMQNRQNKVHSSKMNLQQSERVIEWEMR